MDHQKTFEEFMLGKSYASVPSPTVPSASRGSKSISTSATKKQINAVFKGFQGRLIEWVDLDEQLRQVLLSIANLRDRILWANQERAKARLSSAKFIPEWKVCGFRSSEFSFLTPDDIDLALTNDLLQHERMLSGARTLVACLSQAQESMGRRIEEWMMAQFEEGDSFQRGAPLAALDECKLVYILTTEELYRKQVLLQRVFDSACDNALVEEIQSGEEHQDPCSVIRDCLREWSSRKERCEDWVKVERLVNIGQ